MIKRVLFAAALYVAGIAAAFAGDCITLDQARAIAKANDATIERLTGAQFKTAREIFNAGSGNSAPIQIIILVTLPNGMGGLLAVGPDQSQLCAYGQLDARQWRTLRNSIFGTGA